MQSMQAQIAVSKHYLVPQHPAQRSYGLMVAKTWETTWAFSSFAKHQQYHAEIGGFVSMETVSVTITIRVRVCCCRLSPVRDFSGDF
jgi:hypothetical protein